MPPWGPCNGSHLYRSLFQLFFADGITHLDSPVESFEPLPDFLDPGEWLALRRVGADEASAVSGCSRARMVRSATWQAVTASDAGAAHGIKKDRAEILQRTGHHRVGNGAGRRKHQPGLGRLDGGQLRDDDRPLVPLAGQPDSFSHVCLRY